MSLTSNAIILSRTWKFTFDMFRGNVKSMFLQYSKRVDDITREEDKYLYISTIKNILARTTQINARFCDAWSLEYTHTQRNFESDNELLLIEWKLFTIFHLPEVKYNAL